MLSLQLPLTITCLFALLPIPLTICGDPLIWATVEAQAEFKTRPDGGPGGECSLPSTFQMRADGSWLPSSEFDLTGNFDEDCGIYLHLSIPEDGSAGGKDLGPEEQRLKAEMEELKKKEDALSKEREDHKRKMDTLGKEKEGLDLVKNNLKDVQDEKKVWEGKRDEINTKRNSVKDKLNELGFPDIYSSIEKLTRDEEMLSERILHISAKIYFLNAILGGVCSRMPTSLYLSVADTTKVSSDAKIYICYAKGPDFGNIALNMWNLEISRLEEGKMKWETSMNEVESQELKLEEEKGTHETNMKKLKAVLDTLNEKKRELKALCDEIESLRAKKNKVEAEMNGHGAGIEEIRKEIENYQDKEIQVMKDIKKLEKNIEIYKNLISLSDVNGCSSICDSDYLMIKAEIKYEQQDILVCEPGGKPMTCW